EVEGVALLPGRLEDAPRHQQAVIGHHYKDEEQDEPKDRCLRPRGDRDPIDQAIADAAGPGHEVPERAHLGQGRPPAGEAADHFRAHDGRAEPVPLPVLARHRGWRRRGLLRGSRRAGLLRMMLLPRELLNGEHGLDAQGADNTGDKADASSEGKILETKWSVHFPHPSLPECPPPNQRFGLGMRSTASNGNLYWPTPLARLNALATEPATAMQPISPRAPGLLSVEIRATSISGTSLTRRKCVVSRFACAVPPPTMSIPPCSKLLSPKITPPSI